MHLLAATRYITAQKLMKDILWSTENAERLARGELLSEWMMTNTAARCFLCRVRSVQVRCTLYFPAGSERSTLFLLALRFVF